LSQFLASKVFWQSKIWGLLHNPALQVLYDAAEPSRQLDWQTLPVMEDWQTKGWDPATSTQPTLKRIGLARAIAAASDRAALSNLSTGVNYASSDSGETSPQDNSGLEISHLLSGEKQPFQIEQHQQLLAQSSRADYLDGIGSHLLDPVRKMTCPQQVFWWLWRCLPEATCQAMGNDPMLLLTPAEPRLPDSSNWGNASVTAAMAGALAGYNLSLEDLSTGTDTEDSTAYLATFSFTPIQELIKASRKMRDFWAGSWILHYLSAKVSWALAWKYGPDCLIYPSLFQQPLIDQWLVQGIGNQQGDFKGWPEWQQWIQPPTEGQLLTAGFPNVLVVLLPKDRVQAAMQMAEQTLRQEWKKLSKLVFHELKARHWMKDLSFDSATWHGWLDSQWQTYWSALPVGAEGESLQSNASTGQADALQTWIQAQNKMYQVSDRAASKSRLFQDAELTFLRQVCDLGKQGLDQDATVNVGSWWAPIFDQTRWSLTAVKSFRNWEIPTVFSVRSTVSGVGAAVHSEQPWVPEARVKAQWQRQAGLFDGNEQLNATETLKRGLHLILPKLLQLEDSKLNAAYPDLTAGVAGYLKVKGDEHLEYFNQVCHDLSDKVSEKGNGIDRQAWGIPWIDDFADADYRRYHPRCLNAGWLVEELDISQEQATTYRQALQSTIDQHYPGRSPADWYVLAAGDGDGMNEWLKGQKLSTYRDYVLESRSVPASVNTAFEDFLDVKKRMGPSTHNALSRALLDFSNQLVPYLTEQRYAGRLIYGGGDDVLAYSNLWEWDSWLWDIRQCFRGEKDEAQAFENDGDYWRWKDPQTLPQGLSSRPLFTMGKKASISFGIVIAHHSVPLAIALEQLWAAESDGAKKHLSPTGEAKDAVQVRVLYGNGNQLQATGKFGVKGECRTKGKLGMFAQWRSLLQSYGSTPLEPALFEQAAQMWSQHPVPSIDAISPWTQAFCSRREALQEDSLKQAFQANLAALLTSLWETTMPAQRDLEVQNWLKLAAFMLRHREITLQGRNR